MSDYNLKSYVLYNELYDLYKYYVGALSCYIKLTTTGCKFPEHLTPFLDFPIFRYMSTDEFNECKRLFDANRKRSSRIKKRISKMIEKPCLFLTFTFNDDTLSNTNENTRRRYVRDFLSSFNVPAIANKDFGAEKGREHYHSIIQIEHIDYTLFNLGSLNGKRVIVNNGCDTRISKYIAKLTNHAIKETTKQSRLIYLHMNKLN